MGPGRLGWWTLRSLLVAFLVVGLNPEATCAHGDRNARSDSSEETPEPFCFGELGCMANPILRLTNFPPASREAVQVSFRISSQEDPVGVVVPGMNVQQALKSSFKPSRKTKIIIHGFMNSSDAAHLKGIKRDFLLNNDVNIVWLDWTEGSTGLYSQAVANTRLVGLEVAHFVNWLKDNMGLNPADVHLIGHSLGAHICGYAGENIPGLGRITGLDPAGLFFEGYPTIVRLDPSDAKLVDVIHTDSESMLNLGQGFGLNQPVGHLDFYPNGGQMQPGCQVTGSLLSKFWMGLFDFSGAVNALKPGCDHSRAIELFSDSINSKCPYMAFQCDSFEQYKAGECLTCGADGNGCAPMGLHADEWPGIGSGKEEVQLYSSTGSDTHFCKYHYQVEIQLGELPGTGRERLGKLFVEFLNQNGRKMEFDLTSGHAKEFSSGGKYDFFMEDGEELDDSIEALVTWAASGRGSGSLQNTLSITRISERDVDTYYKRGSASTTNSFCDDHGGPIIIKNQETVKVKASRKCLTAG